MKHPRVPGQAGPREIRRAVAARYPAFNVGEAKKPRKNPADRGVVKGRSIGRRGKAGASGRQIDRGRREGGKALLGLTLVTHQTGPKGNRSTGSMSRMAPGIEKEFYLSMLVDRESSRVAIVASTEGGMDIEKVAHDTRTDRHRHGRSGGEHLPASCAPTLKALGSMPDFG